MATIRPFAALRPPKAYAEQVSSLPYDVMNNAEATAMAAGNPSSFLHICRADIDTGAAAIHDPECYERSAQNLADFITKGFLVREGKPCYYIYRQMMWGRVQTGIVGCASVQEYLDGTIKRHELTRHEKELDRIMHFDACSAQTEPVFLAYRKHEGISHAINEWIKFHKPEYEFMTDDGVTHILWPVDDEGVIANIQQGFDETPYLYIADGHHRTASSAAVSAKRREAKPNYTGEEEFNFLMAVSFCDEDLFIMDYNRVVTDLNNLNVADFITAVTEKFEISPAHTGTPAGSHCFGMYVDGQWYSIRAKEGSFDAAHPIESLDCAILQANLLAPILAIEDPRTSPRIDFVGGIRGLDALEARVNSGEMAVAFSLYPVSMDELFHVADSGEIMPPKSTWFEPKLRSGLFVHKIED